jgi:hypothetical protein
MSEWRREVLSLTSFAHSQFTHSLIVFCKGTKKAPAKRAGASGLEWSDWIMVFIDLFPFQFGTKFIYFGAVGKLRKINVGHQIMFDKINGFL